MIRSYHLSLYLVPLAALVVLGGLPRPVLAAGASAAVGEPATEAKPS